MNIPRWPSLLALLFFTAFAPASQAAVWYLNANQTSNSNTWNTMSNWKPNADGSGSSPSSLSVDDTYYVNGKTMRTPNSDSAATDTQTFGGGTLVLNGNGIIVQKSRTAIVTNLISEGGMISDGNSSSSNNLALQVANLTINGTTTFGNAQASASIYTLNFTTLTGSGGIVFSTSGHANNRIVMNTTTATGYTGTMTLSAGTFDFNSGFTSGGAMVVNTGTNFILDQNLTFAGSLTIGAAVLGEGTYSWSTLKSTYSEFANSTAGSITIVAVPEPSAVLLLLGAGTGLFLIRRRLSNASPR